MSEYPDREGNKEKTQRAIEPNRGYSIETGSATASTTTAATTITNTGSSGISPSPRPSISDYYHYQYQSSPGGSLRLLKRASLPRPNKMEGSTLLYPGGNGFFEVSNNNPHLMYNSGMTPGGGGVSTGSSGAYAAYAYSIGSPSGGMVGVGTPGGEYFTDAGHSGFTPTGSMSGPSGSWFGPELLPGSTEELAAWSPASNGFRSSSLSGSFSGPVLMPYSLVPNEEHKPHHGSQLQHAQGQIQGQGQGGQVQAHAQSQQSQQSPLQQPSQHQQQSHQQSHQQSLQQHTQHQHHHQTHAEAEPQGHHAQHIIHTSQEPAAIAAAVTAAATGATAPSSLHHVYYPNHHSMAHANMMHGNAHVGTPNNMPVSVIPGTMSISPGKTESSNTSGLDMESDNPNGLSKKYQCHICGKYYRRDLPRHLRTHQEVARFTCPFPKDGCPHKRGQFNRPYDFKKHLLHGHFVFDENKTVRSYRDLHSKLSKPGTCGCGRRFTANDWLDNHVFGGDDPCPLLVRDAMDNLKASLELSHN